MSYLKDQFLFPVLAFIILASVGPFSSTAQVYGCKDPMANNYNTQATINDGSCTYNTTNYTPPIKVDPIHTVLAENSGLQMAGNFLWTINDGGGAAALYRIDTVSNEILQTVTLGGATNVDWEEIAFDGTHFYIGDFGNNVNGARTDLKIYKFPFSAIPDHVANPTVEVPAAQIEVINFIYSDQPQPPVPSEANNTKFDCEAMIVDGGKIHLFTKNWVDINTTHYVIPGIVGGTYTALPLETLATNYLVTGADKAIGQEVVAFLGYQNSGFASHFMHFFSDYSGGLYFNGNKRRIDLPDATVMGQGEGITFRNGTYGYLSNERFVRTSGSFTLTVNQKLRSFNSASFVSSTVLPLGLKQFNATNINGTHKLTWTFDTKVESLQIQHSTNGVDFSNLKTYNSSTSDTYYNKPLPGINCYRLAWKKNNGASLYSNNVCITSEVRNAIRKLTLKSTGELTFILDGNEPRNYSFKLITVDGKLISETAAREFTTGSNTINFQKNLAGNKSAFLISNSNNQQETVLLHIGR